MPRAAAIGLCVALLAAVPAGAAPPRAPEPPVAPDSSASAGTPRPRPVDPAKSAWLRFDDPGPYEALLTWFPPFIIRAGGELKDFIRSDAFAAWRSYAGDGRAVDAIWVRAMSLTSNNTSLALLAATVATFDHYVVGLRIPALALYFPLTNESAADFRARVRNLPALLYPDSPARGHGDRDKLQHFFGAAFVAFTFESSGAAQRFGDFVEAGEDAVIVDGVLDSRDERANWNGSEFGTALLAGNRRYPSGFFRTPVVGGPGAGPLNTPFDHNAGRR